MPRQRVEVKRIENRQALQVTFSKRRKGLFKKAEELATMCKAKVAVLVFSAASKFTFYAHPSLDEVIEKRYHQKDKQQGPPLALDSNLIQEHERLSRKYVEEEFVVSQMEGLNLENLPMEHLNQLEERMQNTLRLVKEKKEGAWYDAGVLQRQQQGQEQEQEQEVVPHEQVVVPQERVQLGLVPNATNNNEMDLNRTNLSLDGIY